MLAVDSVHCMVFFKCSYKHLVQSYPKRLSKTSDSHLDTIRFCRFILYRFLLVIDRIPRSSPEDTGSTLWHSLSFEGGYQDHSSSGDFSDWRSFTFSHGHHKDTSVSGPYHQRSFSAIHGLGLPLNFRYSISSGHVHISHSPHIGRHARMLG